MVDIKAVLDEDLNLIKDENVLLRSNNSLGHGIMEDIHDIIYVKQKVIQLQTILPLRMK